jgi:hypothetical protein
LTRRRASRHDPSVQQPRFFKAITLTALATAGAASVACEPPRPVKTASGDSVQEISYEETFPLSTDRHEVTFHGDRLRRAVELLDKHGVMGLSGDFKATGVLDKSTLTLVVLGADRKERKVVAKNCAETHVCAFFAEAVTSGLVDKTPVVCRDPVPCAARK